MLQSRQDWSQKTFGKVQLGDKRLNQRAVEVGQALARRPSDSLSQQMGSWSRQKATNRLLDNDKVSHEALSQPHWYQTRDNCDKDGMVSLMVQDITELDYSSHKATKGLGPIGNHGGDGMMLHNTLALDAEAGEVQG